MFFFLWFGVEKKDKRVTIAGLADRAELGDAFCERHKLKHMPKRSAHEIAIEARADHCLSLAGPLVAVCQKILLENFVCNIVVSTRSRIIHWKKLS